MEAALKQPIANAKIAVIFGLVPVGLSAQLGLWVPPAQHVQRPLELLQRLQSLLVRQLLAGVECVDSGPSEAEG